jgi:hypothetical protein
MAWPVAAVIGAFGQPLAAPFYFADMGFAFVGVGVDGGGGVDDGCEGHGAADDAAGRWRAGAASCLLCSIRLCFGALSATER